MAKELIIPEEYVLALNRLMQRIPVEFREDRTVRKTALIFLKVGGEKLARASLKALTTPFSEKFMLRKMQLNDDSTENETASDDDQENGSDDDQAKKEDGGKTLKDESVKTEGAEPSPASS